MGRDREDRETMTMYVNRYELLYAATVSTQIIKETLILYVIFSGF